MGIFIINIPGILLFFSVIPISLGSRKLLTSFSWIVLSRRYSRPSVVHEQDNREIARRKTFSWWRNNVAFQPTPRLYRKRRETSHFWSSDPPRIILKLCHSRWIIDQRRQKIVIRVDKIVWMCMWSKATSKQVRASVYFDELDGWLIGRFMKRQWRVWACTRKQRRRHSSPRTKLIRSILMLVVSVIDILRTIEMNWTGIDRDTRPYFIFAADESSSDVRWICKSIKSP